MDLVIKNLTEDQSNTIAAFAHAVKTESANDVEAQWVGGKWNPKDADHDAFYPGVKYRIKPLPSYLDLHKKSGLKVGDRVKIICSQVNESEGYEFTSYDQNDYRLKGYTGEITCDEENFGFWVDGEYLLPYYALEKIEEEWIVKFTGSGAPKNPVWNLDPTIYKSKEEAEKKYKNCVGVWSEVIKIK